MNLFTARLTGKMLSTEKFEKTICEMQERDKRWHQIEKSPELAEYLELKKIVESSAFQSRKKELATRKYKDTDEGRKMMAYKRLVGSRSIRRYKRALEDQEFQQFLQFRETEDFQKVNSIKACLKSGQMRRYNIIYHSSFYKNYTKVLNSKELRQLTELEKEVHTEAFLKRHALWADAKRWLHSEEYKTEQRYLELAASDDIKFFYTKFENKIDWPELFSPVFADEMENGKNWKPGYGYANPAAKDGHSRTTERQAFNGGKNTFFVDGRMSLETREESKKAVAWDEKKGFIEQVFDYTSDVMNTKEAFSQESGLFMAKVRSLGACRHFFGLTTGKQKSPVIALYHFNGKKHQMGIANGAKTEMADLTGVSRAKYFIYTFRWTKNELIWYVNNVELLRLPNRLPKEPMFLLAQSWLPLAMRGSEGKLRVQWVRAYKS